MLNVATVFKTGGCYNRSYVERLKAAFERHLPIPHKFVCLTDEMFADYCIPLRHAWPGWWSKIELFRPDLFNGPVLAVDLDTVIINDLTLLVQHNHPFVMMHDFVYPKYLNSCLMFWQEAHNFIYKAFCVNPTSIQKAYTGLPLVGDQGFIEVTMQRLKRKIVVWQDILPLNFLINYQLEVLAGKSWEQSNLCWWTAGQKPHELLDQELIKRHWV